MQYTKFGNTGLEVSRLALGCMSFGVPERGIAPWSLPEKESKKIIRGAIDLGINYFDTANVYSDGTSEEFLGKVLNDIGRREEMVVATKAYFPMFEGPNSGGLSRKSLFREVDASLERLNMDYIDHYVIHRLDKKTPIEETMEALHDIVKSGKVRYIGASSMYAWQFQQAQHVAEKNGWTKFVSMQNLVNLIYREEEREMLPFCKSDGIAVTPWSPLAKGRLVRDVDTQTERSEIDPAGKNFFGNIQNGDKEIIERVAEIANERGASRAQIALAWVLQKEEVTSPIIGTTKLHQLEDSVKALSIDLTEEEIAYLEEPYVPHAIVGF